MNENLRRLDALRRMIDFKVIRSLTVTDYKIVVDIKYTKSLALQLYGNNKWSMIGYKGPDFYEFKRDRIYIKLTA